MDKKEKQKEFIYFPSLSAGGFASALIKNDKPVKLPPELINRLVLLKDL